MNPIKTPTLDACVNAAHSQMLAMTKAAKTPGDRLRIYRLTSDVFAKFLEAAEDSATKSKRTKSRENR
jgi:hypothetical protein